MRGCVRVDLRAVLRALQRVGCSAALKVALMAVPMAVLWVGYSVALMAVS